MDKTQVNTLKHNRGAALDPVPVVDSTPPYVAGDAVVTSDSPPAAAKKTTTKKAAAKKT